MHACAEYTRTHANTPSTFLSGPRGASPQGKTSLQQAPDTPLGIEMREDSPGCTLVSPQAPPLLAMDHGQLIAAQLEIPGIPTEPLLVQSVQSKINPNAKYIYVYMA